MAMNKVRVNSDAELKDRLVAINRVTKVTKGGRTFTFAAIVVVGDGKGVIGYGLGKAGEVTATVLVRPARLPPLSRKAQTLPRRTSLKFPCSTVPFLTRWR